MTTDREVRQILREEMDTRGWHNNDWRAGLAAIVGGESGFVPKWELTYKNTDNARIRRFFGSRVSGLSDRELDEVKRDERVWFNRVYGPEFNAGRSLGNRYRDDGYRFRGGGLIQLTGRTNYSIFGPLVGVDLVSNPELIVTPRVSAAVAVEYMKKNFHGGDFGRMKAAVGNSIGEPDAEKNRLYAEFRRTGEWDYDPTARPEVEAQPPDIPKDADPVIRDFLAKLQEAEAFLKEQKFYTGPIDLDPGPGFRAGLKAYLKRI